MSTESSLQLSNIQFLCALNRRLGLAVTPVQDQCEGCHQNLDQQGHHRSTCMGAGRVQLSHKPLVKSWRQIFFEAGTSITDRNVERRLGTTLINKGVDDSRRMDLISNDIS